MNLPEKGDDDRNGNQHNSWMCIDGKGWLYTPRVNSFCILLKINQLTDTIQKLWEVPCAHPWTAQEKLCENIFANNVVLSFKEGLTSLSYSSSNALRCIFSLEERLKSDH